MQLTAPLCCREAAGNIGSSPLHSSNFPFNLERHFSLGPRQFAAQLDGLDRMELNLQAFAFNTQGINHLWQPGVQTQMGFSWWSFFCLSSQAVTELTHTVLRKPTVAGEENTRMIICKTLTNKSMQRIKSWILKEDSGVFHVRLLQFCAAQKHREPGKSQGLSSRFMPKQIRIRGWLQSL